MLRYVLETSTRVDEAIAALSRIPIAQSHNVTLLDRSGSFATAFLGPDRTPARLWRPASIERKQVGFWHVTEVYRTCNDCVR
jgi:predicted choloylglycine hydrolase